MYIYIYSTIFGQIALQLFLVLSWCHLWRLPYWAIISLTIKTEQKTLRFFLGQGVKNGVKRGVKRGVKKGVKKGVKRGVKTGVKKGVMEGVKEGVKLQKSLDKA